MIFVTLGSQKFQFNRLLRELDKLIEEKKINEEVFAQIGYSDYKPQHFEYKEFVDRDEFKEIMDKCDVVIAHGGTGAIITAVKKDKKVIAIPRLAKYGEHVDDHQIQLVDEFKELNLIYPVYDEKELERAVGEIRNMEFERYSSNTKTIISDIELFIESRENNGKN